MMEIRTYGIFWCSTCDKICVIRLEKGVPECPKGIESVYDHRLELKETYQEYFGVDMAHSDAERTVNKDRKMSDIITIPDGFGDEKPHEVGDGKCTTGWCGGNRYPRTCKCGGLIHAEFAEEIYEGGYNLNEKCDHCGDEYEEELLQGGIVTKPIKAYLGHYTPENNHEHVIPLDEMQDIKIDIDISNSILTSTSIEKIQEYIKERLSGPNAQIYADSYDEEGEK